MRVKIGILLLLVTCNAFSQNEDKKACKAFEEKITLVENFYNDIEGYSLELESATVFLAELTKITPETNYSYKGLGTLSVSDLTDWKLWYKENKHLLYWDNKSQSIKI